MLLVGLKHGAGEGSVAAAMAAVLRRTGAEPRVERLFEYDVDASPLVAARHAGDTLEPAALTAALQGGLVLAAVPGGLLAPITRNFSVRDLAAGLRRPVVLVTPATPDATNLIRLSLAAARAARLVVPAIVLTGWPDPPDRVQIDEQRLLGELSGTDVRTLPASPSDRAEAVRDWPITAWLEAAPPEAAPSAPPVPRARPGTPAPVPRRSVDLDPYEPWTERPTGDPRATPRPRIMEAMLEIVAAEGPIVAQRAYTLYNRASGGKKLTTTARAPLSSALHWLEQEQKIAFADDVARLPDQPAVRVRELGDRVLEEVPLEEIAELMRRLGGPDKRAVLSTYGLVRLTQRADEYLDAAIGRL